MQKTTTSARQQLPARYDGAALLEDQQKQSNDMQDKAVLIMKMNNKKKYNQNV